MNPLLSGVKTLWDLLQELYEKRWVRYLMAALFPLFGILLGVMALQGIQLHTISGTIGTVAIRTDSQTGDYQEHLITLAGSTTHYTIQVNYFTPTLAQDGIVVGQRVEMWYEDKRPFFDPDVDAIQVYDASGTPTRYVTSAYTDPVGANRNNLITAGSFLLLGVLALAAAIWVPTKDDKETARAAPTPATRPNYGEYVLGSPRRPPEAG